MFTGIIEEVGKVRSVELTNNSGKIKINANKILNGTQVGDSISVSGVCLTVVELLKDSFVADIMPETFKRTKLSTLSIGKSVNLERAMVLNGRFGGHVVTGHIDDLGLIYTKNIAGNSKVFEIILDKKLIRYVVEKGSVTVDGVSLTVMDVKDTSFFVSIIPHTFNETTLHDLNVGDKVNIEVDIIAKYTEKLINNSKDDTDCIDDMDLKVLLL